MGIFDIFSGDSADEAAAANREVYARYAQQGSEALGGARTRALDAFAQLTALGSKYGRGSDLYFDALGINGPEGMARARGAFTTSPGYDFRVKEATDRAGRAISRFSPGGNEAAEIARISSGMAGDEYGRWIGALGQLPGLESNVVGGDVSGRAGIETGYGQNLANVYGNVASGEANSNTAAANSKMEGNSNFWNGLLKVGGTVGAAALTVF